MHPPIEPDAHGTLDVGDGDRVYWETSGNPNGQPAVVLHGGPGSGCDARDRRLFDPEAYRAVLFDQRGCGRSSPSAADPLTDLETNDTEHLIADIEHLREHLGIDRWLVTGGSWGSALALAYAERYPHRVRGMVLWGVNSAARAEFDWLFRGGLARFFPQQWQRLRDAVPAERWQPDIVDTYADLLADPDPSIRHMAATEWCRWESATPSWPPIDELAERFTDPAFAYMFARLVTHYVRHDAWLGDEVLLRGLPSLEEVPAVLIQGRFDFQAPLGSAWEIHRRWRSSDLIVVDRAGHDAGSPNLTDAIIGAIQRFAS